MLFHFHVSTMHLTNSCTVFFIFLPIIPSLDSGFWTVKGAEGNTRRRFCWAQMPATLSNEVSHLQADLRRDTWHLRRARDTSFVFKRPKRQCGTRAVTAISRCRSWIDHFNTFMLPKHDFIYLFFIFLYLLVWAQGLLLFVYSVFVISKR